MWKAESTRRVGLTCTLPLQGCGEAPAPGWGAARAQRVQPSLQLHEGQCSRGHVADATGLMGSRRLRVRSRLPLVPLDSRAGARGNSSERRQVPTPEASRRCTKGGTEGQERQSSSPGPPAPEAGWEGPGLRSRGEEAWCTGQHPLSRGTPSESGANGRVTLVQGTD